MEVNDTSSPSSMTAVEKHGFIFYRISLKLLMHSKTSRHMLRMK
jgi:hypothetical protein